MEYTPSAWIAAAAGHQHLARSASSDGTAGGTWLPSGPSGKTCHRRRLVMPAAEVTEKGSDVDAAGQHHRLQRVESTMDRLELTTKRLNDDFESFVTLTRAQQLTLDSLVARLR